MLSKKSFDICCFETTIKCISWMSVPNEVISLPSNLKNARVQFFKHQSSYQQSLILLCKINTNIEGVLQQKKDYLNKEEQNKYNSSYKKEFETSRTCITGTLKLKS